MHMCVLPTRGGGTGRLVMKYSGFDPYDALRGSRVPAFVRNNARLRQLVVQVRKRTPFDLARPLGITPFTMAKTLGAALTVACRDTSEPQTAGEIHALSRRLREDDEIARMEGGAWGYEFDVQTRWAFYPAGSANLIATVFVARGLGSAAAVTGEDGYLGGMREAADFLQQRLLRGEAELYFAYTLTTDRLIHNANLLGAGLLGMTGALSANEDRVRLALSCARTSIKAQRPDGSWPYGDGSSLGWSDNFHTAYNLDGLLQVWLASGDEGVRASLEQGVRHWMRDFFGPGGEPRYYPTNPYPYDIHSAGTAVDVAVRLARWGFETEDVALRVAEWTRKHLLDHVTGATYFQKRRLWTDKRHFVRWGDAHWALGESALRLMEEGRHDPLEAAVASAAGTVTDAR